MSKRRIKRCPQCGFSEVIKWGVRNGYQRYKCKNCGSFFCNSRADVSNANKFVWFRDWGVGKQTLSEISSRSGEGVN